MNLEEAFTRTLSLLEKSVIDRKEQTEMLLRLLEESESRISETNRMIQSLVSVCQENQKYLSTITKIYTEQFESIETSRENCQQVNKGLIEALDSANELFREERRRYDILAASVAK